MESNTRESLPPQEKIVALPKWDSAYKPIALQTLGKAVRKEIKRKHPEETKDFVEEEVLKSEGKLKGYLDAIDREIVDNFGVFESKENSGVRFPFTKISINKVAHYAQNQPSDPETKELPKKTYVIFRVFSKASEGAPDDDMNTIYDRVFAMLPETAKREARLAKNIEIYALGLPTSKWGSVTDDWLNKVKENGFSEYGKLYAEFLRKVLPQEPETTGSKEAPEPKRNIIFFGASMGTILADQTARQMPEIWKDLKLQLDGPTGSHEPTGKTIKLPFMGKFPLSAKGTQVLAGFGIEAGIRMMVPKLDNVVRSAVANALPARDKLNVILQERGVKSFESDEDNRLKNSVFTENLKSIARGSPLDTENFRSHIAQPMLDPATTSGEKIEFLFSKPKNERFFKAGKRALAMGVGYTHWMDRGRWPLRWLRAIKTYDSSTKAQSHAEVIEA